jgi:hypothetical protein
MAIDFAGTWRWTCLAAGIVICLSGCVGMDSASQALKGHDITVVVTKLGYPTEKREMLGHTIYRWNTGNPNGLEGLYCDLDIVIDKDNNIERLNWDGNNGGCQNLANRLK